MSGRRVVWSEGMFLRTQHFQQQDRWVEELVRGTWRDLSAYGWGFRALEIDQGALADGTLALRRASGILPDGTPFALPEQAPLPEPLDLRAAPPDMVVHLVLPRAEEGGVEIEPPGAPPAGARYTASEVEIRDSLAGTEGRELVHLAEPRFRLLREDEPRGAYAGLAVARATGIEGDGGLGLDPAFVPPALRIEPAAPLVAFLGELAGTLRTIAETCAAILTGKKLQGAGDIEDFLILQLCNRTEPVARHHALHKTVHPEELYRWLLTLLGEAASFLRASEPRPPELPAYRHEAPWLAFPPLMAELRRVLRDIGLREPPALPIPLKTYPSGVRAADVQDRSLYAGATFILAFAAPVPAETIRQRLPGQIKVGPAEEMQSLVRSAVPGIPIRHLPTVPREIPLHRGMVYFELDRDNEFWRRLQQSAALAFHVTGDLRDGMEMECWAIRQRT